MSTKVKKIYVENLGALGSAEVNLKGCNVIVTGRNGIGKSYLLRALIDRLQGDTTNLTKKGETAGEYIMELTDGCKIEWLFNDKGGDKIIFTQPNGEKFKGSVITEIQKRYFAGAKSQFSIDEFLEMTPMNQANALCNIIGLDLTDVNFRYQSAFTKRTDAKRDLDQMRAKGLKKPVKPFDKPEIKSLLAEKRAIELSTNEANAAIRMRNSVKQKEWIEANDKLQNEVTEFNKRQNDISLNNSLFVNELKELNRVANRFIEFINFAGIEKFIAELPQSEPLRMFVRTNEPEYESEIADRSKLTEIESKIQAANNQLAEYAKYELLEKQYAEWLIEGKALSEKWEKLDNEVKSIYAEKLKMIANSKLPAGFTFGDEGLLFDGFLLNRKNQSSSRLYIAGLMLASLTLGELRYTHFDASFLDKNSLLEVEKYANSIDLQIAIERPDYEAGELRYEIIESVTI